MGTLIRAGARLVLGFAAAAGPLVALAGVENDIPSCYAANKITHLAQPPELEVILLVDHTTGLDDKLAQDVRDNFGRLIRPQASFVIATFSAFAQGRYTDILSTGTLEGPLAPKVRDDVSVSLLKRFDACMADQVKYGRNAAAAALNKALAGQSPNLARSDILSSLREVSARVKGSQAREKILFLVSDMLENSSITSFYGNRTVRVIDAAAEMKKAQNAKLIGNFGGARVYVLGAGLMQDSAARDKAAVTYRDPRTMGALREFWEAYFSASNARIVEFGTPALLAPVR